MESIRIETLYQIYLLHSSITTDTRKIKTGDLFFALKGENFDGNLFGGQAIAAGAAYAIVDDAKLAGNDKMLYCHDVLETLQQLARHHRQQLNIPVVAITGSNGKTTTKELVHVVLSSKYKTYTTEGNLNNHIGIPLTLLKIRTDAEMAVVEMGANHQKEIEGYCQYTLPTHGMITNCGKAHLEGFGGVEGVRKGKGELFDYLRQHEGEAFICDDFDYFHTMATGLKHKHWYGTNAGEVMGLVINSEPFLTVSITAGFENDFILNTNLVGAYNLYNVLAACAIGKRFGIDSNQIKDAIEGYQPNNSRSQLIELDGNKIILDAYNANPTSMQAAIENFGQLQVSNKILFLGGMMELGNESIAEHEALVKLLDKYPWKEVVLVGGDFARIQHPYRFFNNSKEAATWWKLHASEGNYLLVKGSRSVKMEQILK